MSRIIIFTDLTTYGVGTWNTALTHMLRIPAYIVTEAQQIRDFRPDLVVFSNAEITSNIKAQALVRKLNIPYVVVTHLATDENLKTAIGIYKSFITDNLASAKKIIAVSDSIRKKLQQFTSKDIELIYPGPPKYFYVPKELEHYKKLLNIKNKLYLTVARLCKTKGYYRLLDAIEEMRDTAPAHFAGATFAFVGGGPEELKITEEVYARDLGSKVLIAGQQSPESVGCWYDSADVFVLPSFSEGLPIALIEAAQHRVPSIIVTPVDGVKEVFGSITTDAKDLVKALCNPPQNGEEAADIYLNKLTMAQTYGRVKECLLSLL